MKILNHHKSRIVVSVSILSQKVSKFLYNFDFAMRKVGGACVWVGCDPTYFGLLNRAQIVKVQSSLSPQPNPI